MLLAVYSFNFLDRQILSILAQPVKADLGLSDAQMGALGGLAFALFYATMAIPLGLVADRKGRARVIAISLAVWSLFTALCGMAGSFTQMFLCRLGVGVGEAGGVAPSYALITERFPPERRARAIAVYSLGIPLGSAAGALFGAAIAAAVDWRAAFMVLGLAGLVLALPFHLSVRDKPLPPAADAAPASAVFRRLAGQPVFWLLSFGAGAGSLCGYGLAFWLPALLQRSFGLTLMQAGQFIGAQLLLTGMAGVLAGGILGDRLGHGDRAGYARVPAIAYLLSGPLFAAAFMAPSAMLAFVILLAPSGLAYVWLGPVITAIQHLVPPQERATASACFLLVNNGVGLGFGSLVIGKLSDHFTASHGEGALRLAMALTAGSYLIAALLMLLAAPRLRAAWRD
ncbi:MAG: MFS transporter [Sphingomonadales bacterium]|nr:MFS transporter [Sphingomonadales bacterium]